MTRRLPLKAVLVVGARPNFMKVAPIHREMKKFPGDFAPVLVHTGQHYDRNMSDLFFRDLELPEPDVYLGVGSASHAVQTAKVHSRRAKDILEGGIPASGSFTQVPFPSPSFPVSFFSSPRCQTGVFR